MNFYYTQLQLQKMLNSTQNALSLDWHKTNLLNWPSLKSTACRHRKI